MTEEMRVSTESIANSPKTHCLSPFFPFNPLVEPHHGSWILTSTLFDPPAPFCWYLSASIASSNPPSPTMSYGLGMTLSFSTSPTRTGMNLSRSAFSSVASERPMGPRAMMWVLPPEKSVRLDLGWGCGVQLSFFFFGFFWVRGEKGLATSHLWK